MATLRIDHVVILVADLPKASAAFERQGFTVTRGGVHSNGSTHNALIPFADGSYLELLAFTRRLVGRALPLLSSLGLGSLLPRGRDAIDERFRTRAESGRGLIDFALQPSDLDGDIARARAEGIRIEGPTTGGRAGPDGERVSWKLALPEPPEMPFYCVDVSDRSQRVPTGDARVHENGATGIGSVVVAVERLEASSARYRSLLGIDPEPASRERMGAARGRLFRLEHSEIVLATATDTSHPVGRRLKDRGEGPCQIELTSDRTTSGPTRIEVEGASLRIAAAPARRR